MEKNALPNKTWLIGGSMSIMQWSVSSFTIVCMFFTLRQYVGSKCKICFVIFSTLWLEKKLVYKLIWRCFIICFVCMWKPYNAPPPKKKLTECPPLWEPHRTNFCPVLSRFFQSCNNVCDVNSDWCLWAYELVPWDKFTWTSHTLRLHPRITQRSAYLKVDVSLKTTEILILEFINFTL